MKSFVFVLLSLLLGQGESFAFEIIAHRGVHQEVFLPLTGPVNHNDCEKVRYVEKKHKFLENTIPSIREAFRIGADRVEIDLQPTRDGEVVLFHDNSLECKTGEKALLVSSSLKELKALDLAAGYKFQGSENHLLKGSGLGALPTLREVFRAFPGKPFLINPKDGDETFLKKLSAVLREQGGDLSHLTYWGPTIVWNHIKKENPTLGPRLSNFLSFTKCLTQYKQTGWFADFPEECKNTSLVIDRKVLVNWDLWGGVIHMRDLFHQHNSQIYILHPIDLEDVKRWRSLGFDGVITSKIEEILVR